MDKAWIFAYQRRILIGQFPGILCIPGTVSNVWSPVVQAKLATGTFRYINVNKVKPKCSTNFYEFGDIKLIEATIETSLDHPQAKAFIQQSAIRATSWEKLFLPYANNKSVQSDQRLCCSLPR